MFHTYKENTIITNYAVNLLGFKNIFGTILKRSTVVSEGTIPIEDNLIRTVGRETHEKIYAYVNKSVCNQ